jgi:hypothetical protein
VKLISVDICKGLNESLFKQSKIRRCREEDAHTSRESYMCVGHAREMTEEREERKEKERMSLESI